MKNEKLFISQQEYRQAKGISNSELLMMQHNPGDYVWSKNAPVDLTAFENADIGVSFHTAMLEPEKFDESVLISSFKTRTSQGFQKEIDENQGKTVLTESESEQLSVMRASAFAHPAIQRIFSYPSDKESSIFVHDKEHGVDLKCRPDIDAFKSAGFLANLKTTASLDEWRQPVDKHWINPLHKFNYGHGAAYELYVASLYYGEECKTFKYPVVQKSPRMGMYPVAVFTLEKADLVEWGFWDQMLENLRVYADCVKNNSWVRDEIFIAYESDTIRITEE